MLPILKVTIPCPVSPEVVLVLVEVFHKTNFAAFVHVLRCMYNFHHLHLLVHHPCYNSLVRLPQKHLLHRLFNPRIVQPPQHFHHLMVSHLLHQLPLHRLLTLHLCQVLSPRVHPQGCLPQYHVVYRLVSRHLFHPHNLLVNQPHNLLHNRVLSHPCNPVVNPLHSLHFSPPLDQLVSLH